jgi:hypothetical protein
VNGTILVRDEHGVVVGHVVGIDVLHLERKGVLLLRSFDIGDAFRRGPRFAIVLRLEIHIIFFHLQLKVNHQVQEIGQLKIMRMHMKI